MKKNNFRINILQPIIALGVMLVAIIACDEGTNAIDFRETTFKPTATNRVTTAGQQITFIDSSKSVVSRLWTFSGASISSSDQQQVTVTYPNPGTYPVEFEATDDAGKFNERLFNVKIWHKVVAAFAPDKTTVRYGSTINFINTSSNKDSGNQEQPFDKFEWTFEGGEPSTSVAMSPSVFYATVGSYDVTLKAVRSWPPDSMTVVFPNLINVVDAEVVNPVSSRLAKLGSQIHLVYDKDIQVLDVADKDFFSVTVDGQNYNLTSVALSPTDPKTIIVSLENSVIEGDTNIKLIYNGDIKSADGSAILGSIAGLPITNNMINLFGTRDAKDYGDFENDALGSFPAGWGAWNGTANTNDYEVTAAESHSATKSVQVNLFNDVGYEGWGIEAKGWTTANNALPNGKYQLQVWAKSTIAGKRLSMGIISNGWGQADVTNRDITTEWALYTYDIELTNALPRYYYQQLRATENYTVWIDDVKLYRAD